MNNVTQSYSLPAELVEQLNSHAEEENLSKSLIVRWALEHFFKAAKRSTARAKSTRKKGQ